MAQTLVNIRMDAELKQSMEDVCRELGMNMTTAFTIFAKKMSRERRIPFDVSVDPFYSPVNIAHLERIVADVRDGTAKFQEHDLIEADA
ncbi:type II toxin-antitoxin system RelB/DinJ family antitoxin [Selenomonas sputigena]|uniref:Type II toxin-antitoxin system RelB/DinJ family antitoxin n=1 Tax=Selenomonas sputigena TaxID=69823 RepID=A0ABV3X848_9FIRM